MNVAFKTIGCRLNQAEIETYARQFHAAGHELVPTPQEADLVVVNTCAFIGDAPYVQSANDGLDLNVVATKAEGIERMNAWLEAHGAGTATINGKPLIEDLRFRDRMSRVEIELMALEVTNMRFLDEMRRTGNIGPEVSMLKIKGTEIQQALTELTMQVVGPRALAFKAIDYDGFDDFVASLAARYFNFRKTSIYAGSNEIQRNIYSKMALGL